MTPDQFRARFRRHASTIRVKVAQGTYRFSAYKQHLLSKGYGKPPRVVAIATVRDRLLLKAISNVLAALFPDAKTPLAPEMIASLVDELGIGRFDSFVRLDVQNFYPSVRHENVRRALAKNIRSTRLMSLILDSIRTPVLAAGAPKANFLSSIGVPQGLPLSNILAEMSMHELDAALESHRDSVYFRYVDDVLILCRSTELNLVAERAVNAFAARGLVVHPFGDNSKSERGSLSKPFGYLGYLFDWPRVTVRKESVVKLENSLTKVLTAYKKYIEKKPDPTSVKRALRRCELRLNLKITGCVYEGSRRGWIAFYSQIRHQQLLKHLDLYVTNQVFRFGLQGKVIPKRFVSAYRYAATKKNDKSGFVPNFDNLSADETRGVLDEYFLMNPGELSGMSDQRVAEIFKRKMHKMVVELERDVTPTY